MKPGNCCRRLSPFFYILINIPDTIPQQHLHSWLLPYWVLAWSSPGCTPALRWQLTCTAFHPYWVLQVESWAMSNDIGKATQLVRDRAGYQIQGFWGPDKCFLILNAGVHRGKNKSKVSYRQESQCKIIFYIWIQQKQFGSVELRDTLSKSWGLGDIAERKELAKMEVLALTDGIHMLTKSKI